MYFIPEKVEPKDYPAMDADRSMSYYNKRQAQSNCEGE